MTEQEWLDAKEAWKPLIYVREFASIRRLRLVAAAYVRWLQSLPEYQYARQCADLIEEVADRPMPHDKVMDRLWAMEGHWGLSTTLGPDEQVGQGVSKLVFLAESYLATRPDGPQTAHRKMLELLRCVFGNPFYEVRIDPSWRTHPVVATATAAYDDRAFFRMPEMAAALSAAGCQDPEVLGHCVRTEPHVRGCWVVDLLLEKA
jgi:hypothetical protein